MSKDSRKIKREREIQGRKQLRATLKEESMKAELARVYQLGLGHGRQHAHSQLLDRLKQEDVLTQEQYNHYKGLLDGTD